MSAPYSASGRWGGRLTRRSLPEHDPSIEALTPLEREYLGRTWLLRAAMERRVADSFEVIRDALARRQAATKLVALAHRAIDDEYRHAELSRLVASRFVGRELAEPAPLSLEVPKHEGASPELRDSLFIIGHCLLNETTASAYLEVSLEHARSELAKCALRELLSDEIDHGRIGWAYLASVDARMRADIARWMLPMAWLNLRQWRRETPDDPGHTPALTHHGAPPAALIHAALVDALRTLIAPGLAQLGIETSALVRWLDAGASTDERPPQSA